MYGIGSLEGVNAAAARGCLLHDVMQGSLEGTSGEGGRDVAGRFVYWERAQLISRLRSMVAGKKAQIGGEDESRGEKGEGAEGLTESDADEETYFCLNGVMVKLGRAKSILTDQRSMTLMMDSNSQPRLRQGYVPSIAGNVINLLLLVAVRDAAVTSGEIREKAACGVVA